MDSHKKSNKTEKSESVDSLESTQIKMLETINSIQSMLMKQNAHVTARKCSYVTVRSPNERTL